MSNLQRSEINKIEKDGELFYTVKYNTGREFSSRNMNDLGMLCKNYESIYRCFCDFQKLGKEEN